MRNFTHKWKKERMPNILKENIEQQIIKGFKANIIKHYKLKRIKTQWLKDEYSRMEIQIVLWDMEKRGIVSVLRKSERNFYGYIGE